MKYEIVTISKEKFDKLPKAKQRVLIAQDVIDRIKLGQIEPVEGDTVVVIGEVGIGADSLKKTLEKDSVKCHTCALGGMFVSYIGINNQCTVSEARAITSHKLIKGINTVFKDIFGEHQLSLIEAAFEGMSFHWHDEFITAKKIDLCEKFHGKYKDPSTRLVAICQNIIKNKGEFKP